MRMQVWSHQGFLQLRHHFSAPESEVPSDHFQGLVPFFAAREHSVCFCRTHANAQYFLPAILWVLLIQITNKHHVSAGWKIMGNCEESG